MYINVMFYKKLCLIFNKVFYKAIERKGKKNFAFSRIITIWNALDSFLRIQVYTISLTSAWRTSLIMYYNTG